MKSAEECWHHSNLVFFALYHGLGGGTVWGTGHYPSARRVPGGGWRRCCGAGVRLRRARAGAAVSTGQPPYHKHLRQTIDQLMDIIKRDILFYFSYSQKRHIWFCRFFAAWLAESAKEIDFYYAQIIWDKVLLIITSGLHSNQSIEDKILV